MTATAVGLTRLTGRLPSWLVAALGLLCVVLGAVVITRPATSLGLLVLLTALGFGLAGVLGIVTAGRAPRPLLAGALGALWVLVGIVILLWPGITTVALAAFVGVALVVWGAGHAFGALCGGSVDERIAALALGAASVIVGVLALLWPDVTLLLVGVVFGGWLIMQGVAAVWGALRPRPEGTGETGRSRLGRWLSVVGSAVALVVAGGAAVASWTLRGGTPEIDAFYVPPREVPSEPGVLLRSEPFTRGVPETGRAWRILYTTTRDDALPAVASGIVVVPASGAGRWPVIDLAHGTTGFAPACAPSLAEEPFEAGAFFVLEQVLEEGWAVVATDYIGLGTEGPHPYLVGEPTGRAVLDAARAARQLMGADLGDRHVVWGHSQGGGAALWTGGIASRYAPELTIDGVAALAPAANLPALVESLPELTGGSVFAAFVLAAYTQVYPDVDFGSYVQPAARVVVHEMARRCLAEPGVLVSVLNALALTRDPLVFAADPGEGPLGARLAENIPTLPIPAPLLVAQGADDSLISPMSQAAYVEARCAAGQPVDYRLYSGRNHVPLVEADSPLIPDLVSWTRDRFAGSPVATGCATSER